MYFLNQPYLVSHLLNHFYQDSQRIVIIYEELQLTALDFMSLIITIKKYLQSLSLVGNKYVPLYIQCPVSLLASMFALLEMGAIPCLVDHQLSLDQLNQILNIVDVDFYVSDKEYDHILNYKKVNLQLKKLLSESKSSAYFDCISSFSNIDHCASTELDDALVLFTSGSTGLKKGVRLSHRNIISALFSIQSYLHVKPTDTIDCFLPLCFDYGLYQFFLSLITGAKLILHKYFYSPGLFLKSMISYSGSIFPLVPSFIYMLLKVLKNKMNSFPNVRMITNTGERLNYDLVLALNKIFPQAEIFSMYGLTECKRCTYVPPKMLVLKKDSVGIPMPNLDIWIEDSSGKRQDAFQTGVICVSGPTVMQGYLNMPNETSSVLKQPQGSTNRYLVSGDIGYFDNEGYLYLIGRQDSIEKINGEKISLAYYSSLIDKLPFVEKSLVFSSVIGIEKLIFVVVLTTESKLTYRQYQKVSCIFPQRQKPSYIHYLNEFPVTINGKHDVIRIKKLTLSAYKKRHYAN